jgi:hypothetical protein
VLDHLITEQPGLKTLGAAGQLGGGGRNHDYPALTEIEQQVLLTTPETDSSADDIPELQLMII